MYNSISSILYVSLSDKTLMLVPFGTVNVNGCRKIRCPAVARKLHFMKSLGLVIACFQQGAVGVFDPSNEVSSIAFPDNCESYESAIDFFDVDDRWIIHAFFSKEVFTVRLWLISQD